VKRILIFLALVLPLCTQAQDHHEIGMTVGVANYYGDLTPTMFAKTGYKPMVGIIYKYAASPFVSLRFGASYATITGADSVSTSPGLVARNLSFESRIVELHGGIEVNLLPVDIYEKKVSPYIFAGLAVFYHNPYALDPNDNKVYLRSLSTEGEGLALYPNRKPYGEVNVAFPIGGGMKFLIGKTLMVNLELGFRYTTTDYLDDVSKSYVNLDSLTAYRGKLAAQMSYRGNTKYSWDGNYPNYTYDRGTVKGNDWYWYGNISIAIYFRAFGNLFNSAVNCPKFFGKGD
jgi:hypothetical protein